MSDCLKRNKYFLRILAKAKPNMVKAIIKSADKDLLTTLCECAHNVVKGTVPLKPCHLKHLKRHKTQVRELAKKNTSQHRRRQILQRGGFLPALLAPIAASVLLDLVK